MSRHHRHIMRHRWLLYSILAIFLSMWNFSQGVGWAWAHALTFVVGIVCFFVWVHGTNQNE